MSYKSGELSLIRSWVLHEIDKAEEVIDKYPNVEPEAKNRIKVLKEVLEEIDSIRERDCEQQKNMYQVVSKTKLEEK